MSVRVRFAPSPTGFVHVGNIRTAIINWLFAKSNGGQFMLRLDDTDLERNEKRFEEALYADLSWLGLDHDLFEKQSNRFPRYEQVRDQLIASGRLYPCYETPEELDMKRKRRLAKGEPPIYDRGALQLTADQIKEFEAQGRRPHWRFKLNSTPIAWDDLIRGPVHYEGDRLSDPVLIRADGYPLYTLTSVVDDIDFEITHILRGEDHVTNTAVQVQLFEAITGSPTNLHFGHTTLLMDANGQPLSKRLGSLSIGVLREQGIEPITLLSFFARLGSSLPVTAFYDRDALIQSFDLKAFSRTPPRFDDHDLTLLNHKILSITPYTALSDRPELNGWGEASWNLVRGNIKTLQELKDWASILFGEQTYQTSDAVVVQAALDYFPQGEWDAQTWPAWLQQVKEKTNQKGKALFMPLRQALTGLEHGPEMGELILVMGADLVEKRLRGSSI